MNEGKWNLGNIQELFKERRKGEMEPRIELLITEENALGLLNGRRIPILKVDKDVIWDAEALPEFPFIEQLGGLLRTRLSGTHACPDNLLAFTSRTG